MGMHSSSIREKAKSLRRNKLSYGKIAKALGVSKSTVSLWFQGDNNSEEIKKILIADNLELTKKRWKIIGEKNAKRFQGLRDEAVALATKEFSGLFNNPLFIAGISIYWGEGDSKDKNPLRMANSDPRMIRVYCEFLKKGMHIPKEKIKAWVLLYPELDKKKCESFWQKTCGLGRENFVKSQIIQGRHKTKRLEMGVCNIVVNSRYEKLKMLTWIDLFAKKITI